MKKVLYQIGMLAVAAFAFVACEAELKDSSVAEEVTHVAQIQIGKAGDTKTMVVEGETAASYKWNADDAQYFRVTENGTAGTVTDFVLSQDNTIATLTVSFTGTPSAPYTYEAKYAGSFTQNSPYNPKHSAEQTPLTNTFDPAADVLVSKVITSADTRLGELIFTMGRVVTVNKMTLTGLQAGEVISKVEFTLDKTVNGSSSISVDEETGLYKYNGSKKLTLNYDSTTGVVPTGGNFPVYFTAAPVDAAGIESVVVTTDQHVYTKSNTLEPNPFDGKTITFAIGTMKRFTMAMGAYGEPISTGTAYELVNTQADLISGATYLIVSEKEGSYYALGAQASNNRSGVAIPSPVSDIITIDNTVTPYPVTISSHGDNWYIVDNYASSANNGQYIYNASTTTKSYLRSESTPDANQKAEWTISISDGSATINNVGNTDRGCMVMNYNSGSPLFNVYASVGSYSTLALYIDPTTAVSDTRTPVSLSFSPTNPADITLGDSFTEPTLTKDPSEAPVIYSVETTPASIATINENTGELSITGTGTVTVTATVSDLVTYQPASASYTLTVNPVAGHGDSVDDPLSVAEALVIISGLTAGNDNRTSEYYVSGVISEVTSYNSTYHSITYNITADGNSSSDFITVYSGKGLNGADFSALSNLAVGDQVVVYGCLMKYHNNSTNSDIAEIYQSSQLASLIKAPYFTASVTSSIIDYAGGSTIILNIGANVNWTATINNGASLKIGDASAAASVSGDSDTAVTVIIPVNTAGQTYMISFTTTSEQVSAPGNIEIIQTKQETLLSMAFVAGTDVTEDNYGTLTYKRPIVVEFAKGSGSSYGYYSPIRFYTNNTLTIGSPFSNVLIKKVEFTVTQSGTMTASDGTYSNGTWLGETSSLVLTGGTQTRFSDFTVYYTVDGELPALSSITIDTPPTKTSYTAGGAFDFSGAEVTAHYSNGDTFDVSSLVTTDGATVVATTGTGKTVTVSYIEDEVTKTDTFSVDVEEAQSGPVTVSMSSFSAISGYVGGDTNVSYTAAKGAAATAPAVNNNQIRIYQNGGTLTITANNGKKLKSITIGSAMATSVSVKVDGGSESSSQSISANETYTEDNLDATTVVFTCKGTTSSSRLYLNSLSVTYE